MKKPAGAFGWGAEKAGTSFGCGAEKAVLHLVAVPKKQARDTPAYRHGSRSFTVVGCCFSPCR
ncbi:MAG: hypothetical protein ABWZ25_00425 [Chitinophagaceae bacterium]